MNRRALSYLRKYIRWPSCFRSWSSCNNRIYFLFNWGYSQFPEDILRPFVWRWLVWPTAQTVHSLLNAIAYLTLNVPGKCPFVRACVRACVSERVSPCLVTSYLGIGARRPRTIGEGRDKMFNHESHIWAFVCGERVECHEPRLVWAGQYMGLGNHAICRRGQISSSSKQIIYKVAGFLVTIPQGRNGGMKE